MYINAINCNNHFHTVWTVACSVLTICQTHAHWALIQYKEVIGKPTVQKRQSSYHLISTTGFPILVKCHIYIESAPWLLALPIQHDKNIKISVHLHTIT